MWKWVVRDYFAAFRWEKVKEWLKSGAWWRAFYVGVFMPCMLVRNSNMMYFLLCLPIMFCMIAEELHRENLPKLMFLCPMQREVRMKYVERTYIFRMLFSTAMGALVFGVIWILGHCDQVTMLLLVWNIWNLSLVFCGICNVKGPSNRDPKKETELVTRIGGGSEGANMILSIGSIYVITCCLCWELGVGIAVKLFFLTISLLVQLPLVVKTLRKWKYSVGRAASFERMD